jgi:hypothetical protein
LGMFDCNDGNCLDLVFLCDGNFDCSTGLDEANCDGGGGCDDDLACNNGSDQLSCMMPLVNYDCCGECTTTIIVNKWHHAA